MLTAHEDLKRGYYPQAAQTISAYLNSVYEGWFGVDVNQSQERFEHLLGNVTQPAHLVNPWIVSLRRARNDKAATDDLKKQIAALPEEVRWAVVTLAYKDSLYSKQETCTTLAGLSSAIRKSVGTGKMDLPEEPLFRVNDGLTRRTLLEACRHMLDSTCKIEQK